MSRRSRAVLTARQQGRLQAQAAAEYRTALTRIEQDRHRHEKFPSVDAPGPGRVRLVADEPPIYVTLLVAEQPDPDGGVGGWQEIERDRRTPAILFNGTPRATLSLTCTLDREELGIDDVESRVKSLYSMGRVDETTGEPARIKLLGDAPVHNPLWVMDTLKFTDPIRDGGGHIRQVQVAIGLSEWVDASLEITLPPFATRSTSGKSKGRVYTTHQGDTLRRIALAQLGTQAQWKTLLDANRSRVRSVDPDALLQAGTHLRIPSNKDVTKDKAK